jgi:tetratricopeptide (TPR) repeat protein
LGGVRLDRATTSDAAQADAEALTAQGLGHHEAGRSDEAAALYDRALALSPDDPTALYLSGLLAAETGRKDEAARRLQRLADLRPRHLHAQLALAAVRRQGAEHAAAAEAYRTAIGIDPDHAGARIGLIEALREAGDLDAALAVAEDAARRLPDAASVRSALGALLILLGRPQEAAQAYREAARLEPQAPLARVALAFALVQTGEAEAAIGQAEAAIALDRGSAEAWFALGKAQAALQRHALAAEALMTAVALDPARAAAHLALGAAYFGLLRPDDARSELEQAIALDPQVVQAHVNLGAVHRVTGRLAEARRCYKTALQIDPEFIEAHQALAALLADAGELEASRRHADRVFSRRNFFVETCPDPVRRVLLVVNAGSGNVPFEHLLPTSRFTRLQWYVAYARPGQAEALPAYDVTFNAIGEPDKTDLAEANLAAFARTTPRPLLNPPGKIARTARHLIPELLAGIPDVVTPATVRLDPAAAADPDLVEALQSRGLGLPVLVRPIGSHGGQGLVRAETPEALQAAAAGLTGEAYVTAFHDYRSPDGFYRKYRAIFVDRRPYPYHLAVSPRWMVHHQTAGMALDPVRIEEELVFLADPEAAIGARAMAAVAAIGQRLDLDYAGLDFAILPDGRVLVFEANATMLAHPEAPDGPFARKNPFVARILEAFEAMIVRASPAPA